MAATLCSFYSLYEKDAKIPCSSPGHQNPLHQTPLYKTNHQRGYWLGDPAQQHKQERRPNLRQVIVTSYPLYKMAQETSGKMVSYLIPSVGPSNMFSPTGTSVCCSLHLHIPWHSTVHPPQPLPRPGPTQISTTSTASPLTVSFHQPYLYDPRYPDGYSSWATGPWRWRY